MGKQIEAWKKEYREKIKPALSIILVIFVVCYLLPAVIIMGIEFWNNVVLGETNWSELCDYAGDYAFGRVNAWYLDKYTQFEALMGRMTK